MRNALLIPYLFTTMNWAAVVGLVYYLRNEPDAWQRPTVGAPKPGPLAPTAL